MNIVMVTTNDPAGTAIQLCRAINQHTAHRCRLVTTEIRYNFMFEKDLHVPWISDYAELERVLSEADLFHFHMTADEDLPLGPFTVRQFLKKQPVLHHHHGEPAFRSDPGRFRTKERAQGRRALVSTPDLLRGYPEAVWVPNPVPLEDADYRPRGEYNHRYEIFVGHSPTRKELKNTEEFRNISGRLALRNPRIRVRIIENTAHRDCLRLKKSCDLFFDHLQGYFGVSSLEALSQGVPTFAGIDDWNAAHIGEFAETSELPWVRCRSGEELERRLEEFSEDLALRESVGRASRRWMENHWTTKRVSERLSAVYEAMS